MVDLERARKYRRKLIRRVGKRCMRALSDSFGRQSLVGDPVVFERGVFPFTLELERSWRAVADECREILAERDRLPLLGSISRENRRISRESDWRVFLFYGFGHRSDRNCARCPRTSALLDRVPGLYNAWFSILSPHATVPPHSGITKGLLRCHLGLVVPEQRDECCMRIGSHKIVWETGRCIVFDDMREHSVENATGEDRAILLLDFHRPMRRPAAGTSRALLAAMRRTAYVRDAYRRQMTWEEEFYAST